MYTLLFATIVFLELLNRSGLHGSIFEEAYRICGEYNLHIGKWCLWMINLNEWYLLFDIFFSSILVLVFELAVGQFRITQSFFSALILIGLKQDFHQSLAFIFLCFSAATFDDDEGFQDLCKIQCNCNQKAAL